MKRKSVSAFNVLLVITILISSCSGPSGDIYKIIPETAVAIITVHPGNLLEKGRLQELDFIRQKSYETIFTKKIFEDPESSGINMNEYSTFFIFGKDPDYGCIIMPLEDKDKFEILLADIEKDRDEGMEKGKSGNYEMITMKKGLIIYDNSISIMLFPMDGDGDRNENLQNIAQKLVNLETEECILSDKDFNSFIRRQKDINAWFTSTNISSISGLGNMIDAKDLFPGINNNYGHVFMDFQNGSMTMNTNLRFNHSMKETIDKYNFMDENAIKDLLVYLPSNEIVFVGNTNIDPEKIYNLLKFFNSGFKEVFEKLADSMNMDYDEMIKVFGRETAFSINGIRKFNIKQNEGKITEKDLPSFVAAIRMKDKNFFQDFLKLATEQSEIVQISSYYRIKNQGIPVCLFLAGNDLIISSAEEVIKEIAQNGRINENVTKTDFSNILTKNPVCFFLNLDPESYSEDLKNFIDEELNNEIAENYKRFGDAIKSVSFSANMEEWEIHVEMMSDRENSLYTLLRQLDE